MSYFGSKLKTTAMKPVFRMVKFPVPKTHIGAGKVSEVSKILKEKGCKKTLVITDDFLLKLGLLDSMMEDIKKEGIEIVVYSDVTPDPTYKIVNDALAVCKGCDSVVALGGGSVIDTAKVVAAASSNNVAPEKLEGLLKVKKPTLEFICIPTTAGTGSEATIAAVISDTVTHRKTTVVDTKIVPSHAILDPNLTLGLPIPTTVFTTMDALTHALEAYISDYARSITDEYAEKAVKLIYDNLKIVYNDPQNVEARENLLVASLYAGMAFTQTYVGYVHAFSHNIGGKFGVPHGLGNAVLLPHIMEFSEDKCVDRFAKMADIVGIGTAGDSNAQKSKKFVDSIKQMNEQFDVPKRLEAFDKEGINAIIDGAFKEAHGTYPVPKFLTREEAFNILSKVCKEN